MLTLVFSVRGLDRRNWKMIARGLVDCDNWVIFQLLFGLLTSVCLTGMSNMKTPPDTLIIMTGNKLKLRYNFKQFKKYVVEAKFWNYISFEKALTVASAWRIHLINQITFIAINYGYNNCAKPWKWFPFHCIRNNKKIHLFGSKLHRNEQN